MAAHLCAPCGAAGRWTGNFLFPEDRPSPLFSTFSCIVNVVLMVWHVLALVINGGDCASATKTWVILGIVSAAVNIGFAVYVYQRFAHKVREEGESASHAAWHLFLYDWGVCMYILFCVWLVVWIIMAGNAANDASSGDSCTGLLQGGIVIFILYFIGGAFMIILSLFTECCREPQWKRNAARQQQANRPGGIIGSILPGGGGGSAAPGERRGVMRVLFGPGGNSNQHVPPPQQQQQQQSYQYHQQPPVQPYHVPVASPPPPRPQQQVPSYYQQAPGSSSSNNGYYQGHMPPPQNPNYHA